MKHQDIHKAHENGSGGGQFYDSSHGMVSVGEVMNILVNAAESGHPGVKRAAKRLLAGVAEGEWSIRAGVHSGGIGSNTRSADENRHITLRVHSTGYHLQVTLDGSIRRITGDDGVELVAPWLAPGAEI
jgi:hypothetical protein